MTELIARGRQTGKSTELVKISAETGQYILVPNHRQAYFLRTLADELGLSIPFPLQPMELPPHGSSSIQRDGILIDNLDQILRAFTGVHVDAVTWNLP